MLTMLSYILAILWVLIKFLLVFFLLALLFYEKSLGMIDDPPWRSGIITAKKTIEKEGLAFGALLIFFDLLRMLVVCAILFVVNTTVYALTTKGLQPIDPNMIMIFFDSCLYTIGLWIFFFLISIFNKDKV